MHVKDKEDPAGQSAHEILQQALALHGAHMASLTADPDPDDPTVTRRRHNEENYSAVQPPADDLEYDIEYEVDEQDAVALRASITVGEDGNGDAAGDDLFGDDDEDDDLEDVNNVNDVDSHTFASTTPARPESRAQRPGTADTGFLIDSSGSDVDLGDDDIDVDASLAASARAPAVYSLHAGGGSGSSGLGIRRIGSSDRRGGPKSQKDRFVYCEDGTVLLGRTGSVDGGRLGTAIGGGGQRDRCDHTSHTFRRAAHGGAYGIGAAPVTAGGGGGDGGCRSGALTDSTTIPPWPGHQPKHQHFPQPPQQLHSPTRPHHAPPSTAASSPRTVRGLRTNPGSPALAASPIAPPRTAGGGGGGIAPRGLLQAVAAVSAAQSYFEEQRMGSSPMGADRRLLGGSSWRRGGAGGGLRAGLGAPPRTAGGGQHHSDSGGYTPNATSRIVGGGAAAGGDVAGSGDRSSPRSPTVWPPSPTTRGGNAAAANGRLPAPPASLERSSHDAAHRSPGRPVRSQDWVAGLGPTPLSVRALAAASAAAEGGGDAPLSPVGGRDAAGDSAVRRRVPLSPLQVHAGTSDPSTPRRDAGTAPSSPLRPPPSTRHAAGGGSNAAGSAAAGSGALVGRLPPIRAATVAAEAPPTPDEVHQHAARGGLRPSSSWSSHDDRNLNPYYLAKLQLQLAEAQEQQQQQHGGLGDPVEGPLARHSTPQQPQAAKAGGLAGAAAVAVARAAAETWLAEGGDPPAVASSPHSGAASGEKAAPASGPVSAVVATVAAAPGGAGDGEADVTVSTSHVESLSAWAAPAAVAVVSAGAAGGDVAAGGVKKTGKAAAAAAAVAAAAAGLLSSEGDVKGAVEAERKGALGGRCADGGRGGARGVRSSSLGHGGGPASPAAAGTAAAEGHGGAAHGVMARVRRAISILWTRGII
ncbi:hypothetical protein GPECTOR_59g637 [Gonium pectorale]|uniref:Uncharacterized protein n=1 Tax=Gonium pectorale TaxID=33097 RepID=A0A150G572_GONPE|nr:hypothetical protein GPECTOR_59g637 [Gonium pectorale]|eukprot:KXZ45029.1 hypothetical protein GPECTOR_59g637 [Gonium pectorale]